MSRDIRVRHTITVPAPPEAVFAYTQDYGHRPRWDPGVLSATVLTAGGAPTLPRVRIRARGLRCVFEYLVFDPPRRTSVAMRDIESWLVQSGGGAWTYEACEGGTRWTQAMGLSVRPGLARTLGAPLLRWALARNIRRAMRNVAAHFAHDGG